MDSESSSKPVSAEEAARRKNRRSELTGSALLLIAAMVWGFTFVAQSIGAALIPAFTFIAARNWISFLLLIPVTALLGKRDGKTAKEAVLPDRVSALAGVLCGGFLFTASVAQQIGIAHTTTAKSAFITALYVVIVPVIYAFIRKGLRPAVWISVVLAVVGLYLLSIKEGFSIGAGDAWTVLCAFLYSFQILSINRYVGKVGGVKLTCYSFGVAAVLSTAAMLLFESPDPALVYEALPTILFAGVFSGCIGYTLQAVAQRFVNPAAASLIMSLESVFGALGGWVVLHQVLTPRELLGCVIMFAAILLSVLTPS